MLRIVLGSAASIPGFHSHIRHGRQDLKFWNPLTVLLQDIFKF